MLTEQLNDKFINIYLPDIILPNARMHEAKCERRGRCGVLQCTEEARDNLKFLATLERHFEVLGGGSLSAMADCLPALMGALRMGWIISHYYGDDEKMGLLFRRIANQIGDRIEAAVKPQVREHTFCQG